MKPVTTHLVSAVFDTYGGAGRVVWTGGEGVADGEGEGGAKEGEIEKSAPPVQSTALSFFFF